MFIEVQKINIKVTRYKAEFPFFIDFANNQVKVTQKCFKIGRGMSVYYTTNHISVLVTQFRPIKFHFHWC